MEFLVAPQTAHPLAAFDSADGSTGCSGDMGCMCVECYGGAIYCPSEGDPCRDKDCILCRAKGPVCTNRVCTIKAEIVSQP